MTMHITIHKAVRSAAQPTQRVCQTAAMFGLGVDEERLITIVPKTAIPLGPGKIIYITGPSGGGKSTIVRLIVEQLRQRDGVRVIGCGAGYPENPREGENHPREARGTSHPGAWGTWNSGGGEDSPLIDTVGATQEEAAGLLARAGLGDAFVMLRKVSELSEGQKHRYALARAIDAAERQDGGEGLAVVVADEFGSTLDRITARVLARNVRKWVTRRGVCFIAATAHDDLIDDLQPDVLVVKDLGEAVTVTMRQAQ